MLPFAGSKGGFAIGKAENFTDETIPLGANPVEYIVQGQRGSTFGQMSNVFTITLGSGPGVTGEAQLKIAA